MARTPKPKAAPYGEAVATTAASPPAEVQVEEIGDTNPDNNDNNVTEVDQSSLKAYQAWFRADKEHSAEWRKNAKEDFEFLAGEQWTETERATLKDQMRPVVTFNRTNPIINTISGIEISNRQEVKFYPRQMGNASADEILTNAVEWFRDLASADDEDSDMFLDTTVCGLGCTETTLSFDEDKEGMPSISCVNPLEMWWDHSARKKNFTDASRRWRVRQIPLAKAKAMFKDADENDLDAAWASLDDDDQPIDRDQARIYADQGEASEQRDESMVTIVHLQHKKQVTVYDVKDLQSGQSTQVDEGQVAELKKRAAETGAFFTFTPRQTFRIVTCFIGSKVLLETDAICPDGFSFQFVTGYVDRNTGLPYGVMKIMKDPQRWANKWMSQAMHILNTNAKGGVMVEADAVENIREFEKSWPRNDKVTVVESGALSGPQSKIQPKSQPSMDGSFFNMMQFAISSVRDVTGVNMELQGLTSNNQPASLERIRKQSGVDQLAPLFDNLKRYRRDQGKVMLYIIQKVIPKIDKAQGNPMRLVRIVGKEGAQYVPLALAADVKYDIVVDDQVNTAEQKTQIWQMMLPFIQSMPPQVLLAMLDYSPFPPSVIQKIRDAAQQAMAPDPVQQQVQQAHTQIGLADASAGVDLKKAQAQEQQSKAMRNLAEIGKPEPQPAPPPGPAPASPVDNMLKWAQINRENSVAERNRAQASNLQTQVVSGAPGASTIQQ